MDQDAKPTEEVDVREVFGIDTDMKVRAFYERNERVRSIQRNHTEVGSTFSIQWDGRDDNGLLLPDGEYRMTVQNYEFYVHVDGTPPEVGITLFDAYQKLEVEDRDYVWVAPHIEWHTRGEQQKPIKRQPTCDIHDHDQP